MKLNYSARNTGARSYYFCSFFIYKQQHWRDKRWQSTGQFCGALQGDMAGAVCVHDQADGVSARSYGGIDVFLAGQAADLDTGTA
ncbi:hypothetical protein H4V98_001587 [Polaromonas sp. CG_23.6]|nr:hypothetical protein [Polaromonas sp. CG_23.6]